MKAGSATSTSDPSSSSSLSGSSAHRSSGCQYGGPGSCNSVYCTMHARQQYGNDLRLPRQHCRTCNLGPQAVSLLRMGGRSAALLLRVCPGALQILLQRRRPLALRLRSVPRALQLLLQALSPLASCRQT